jgi:hypothetical protein
MPRVVSGWWFAMSVLAGLGAAGCEYRLVEQAVPAQDTLMAWAESVVARGIRRPVFAADDETEQWLARTFRHIGLHDVRLEPIAVRRWEEQSCALTLRTAEQSHALDCFPVPFSRPTDGVEGTLVADRYDQTGNAEPLRDAIAVYANQHTQVPQRLIRDAVATRTYDPDGDFDDLVHVVPFGPRFQDVMRPALLAGARGFIGVAGQRWDSREYFVPYDAGDWPLPGVWLSPSQGALVQGLMAAGPVTATISYAASDTPRTSHNVIGALPGVSDDWVIIGTHHDAPWYGAVEDASGIALVLAQARYWSRLPRRMRPFNLLFVVTGGHMSGGAGIRAFVASHAELIARTVVAIHLEHVAREPAIVDGALAPGADVVPRWWFTSLITPLEDAVETVLVEENLRRSFVLPPTAFSPMPPTDGAHLYPTGVPIVQLLAAPEYLFDAGDTLDMIHEESLVPITRAVIELVNALSGWDADTLRAQQR